MSGKAMGQLTAIEPSYAALGTRRFENSKPGRNVVTRRDKAKRKNIMGRNKGTESRTIRLGSGCLERELLRRRSDLKKKRSCSCWSHGLLK